MILLKVDGVRLIMCRPPGYMPTKEHCNKEHCNKERSNKERSNNERSNKERSNRGMPALEKCQPVCILNRYLF